MHVHELQAAAYANAKAKGWHDKERTVGELIALMHAELSEALEEHRDGRAPGVIYFNNAHGTVTTKDGAEALKPEGIPIELADVVIRIFDFCGQHSINLEDAIVQKMQYNECRPHRHGGKLL